MSLSRAKEDRLPPAFTRCLTETVASGTTGRGPSALCTDDLWDRALEMLSNAANIALVTGFFVPSASAPETDGPVGTVALARALSEEGHSVAVWTDARCLESLRQTARAIGMPDACVVDATPFLDDPLCAKPDLLVYIERLGRAEDGRYYNMRKEDITEWTAPLDTFALSWKLPTLAIGDGGNEVGMGSWLAALKNRMPEYSACLCTVPVDVCIPVDVSNWGAYALIAAMSKRRGVWLGQTPDEERAMLDALCRCGVVDGVTKVCAPSVDGMDLERQLDILQILQKLVAA